MNKNFRKAMKGHGERLKHLLENNDDDDQMN